MTFIEFVSTLKAGKRKATSQTVVGLPEGEQRQLPPPSSSSTVIANDDLDSPLITSDKFCLHPDDPRNFLKLCSALRILIQRHLTDSNIKEADRLLREYCTELIPVCRL